MHKGKFCWNSHKVAMEEYFAVRKHCRIVIRTELTYLFNTASPTVTVFADFTNFSCLLLVNNFVINAMQTKTFQKYSVVHSEQIHA